MKSPAIIQKATRLLRVPDGGVENVTCVPREKDFIAKTDSP